MKRTVQKPNRAGSSSTSKPRDPRSTVKSAGGAFSRFFQAQQPKVGSNDKVAKLLTQFAEEDAKRIAAMINKWLQDDAKNNMQRRKSQKSAIKRYK